jgi:hypothetical protein
MKVQFTLLLLSIVLNSLFYLLGLRFFTLDDAYIVLKTAENFIQHGHLFSYNVLDGNTNAITSFLFYLISIAVVALVWLINTPLLESYTFIVFTLNFLLLLNTLRDFYQILLNHFTRNTSRLLLVFVSTLYPILTIWTNGLETSLGLFLVVRIVKKLLLSEYRGLQFIVVLLILTRPDLGLSALIVLFILTVTKFLPNLRFFLGGLTVFLFPMIVSKIATGNFLTSSISRVPIGGNEDLYYKLISSIKNLLRAPIYFANFPVPHNGFDILAAYVPTFIKFISIGIFLYFLFFASKRIFSIHAANSSFLLYKEKIDAGKLTIALYLFALLLVSSITGTGLGEFNRYFVFMYVIALILILVLKPKLLNLRAIKLLATINLIMIPSVYAEVGSSIAFNNQVLYPVAKKIQDVTGSKDTIMLDSAGLISIFGEGKIIDVYGLGTQRYSEIHGDFNRVYELIDEDRPDFIVAWKMDKPTYYLDSAHYELALLNAEIIPIFSRQDSYLGKNSYPELIIYRVIYP